MEGLGENFGTRRTVKLLPLRRFPGFVQGISGATDCVDVGPSPEVCQCASDQVLDEANSIHLPDMAQLDQLFAGVDFQLEHEWQFAAEMSICTTETMSDSESKTAPAHQSRPVLPPSETIGITYHKKNKQWEAHLWLKGRQLGKRKKKGTQVFLGNFETQDEAKAAHDKAAIKLDVRKTSRGKPYPLNFPESAQSRYMEEHADWTPRDFVWKIRRFSYKFSKGKSGMKGVSVRCRKGKQAFYEAKISQTMGDGEKRTFDLGKFACEEDAGRAYDRALLFLKGDDSDCVTNFRPSEYSVHQIQEVGRTLFGKV